MPEAFADADLTARTEGALQGAFEGCTAAPMR
jgi:hypothetical protein